jgi:hypothetical protein
MDEGGWGFIIKSSHHQPHPLPVTVTLEVCQTWAGLLDSVDGLNESDTGFCLALPCPPALLLTGTRRERRMDGTENEGESEGRGRDKY